MKRIVVVLLLIIMLAGVSASLYIYVSKDRFIYKIKQNLEKSLSEATGAKIRISSISGNILDKAVIHDLHIVSEYYDMRFDKAKLEYSLLDIIFFERLPAGKRGNTALELNNGLLRFKNYPVEFKDINGKIKLAPDKIILEALRFDISGIVETDCEGEIALNNEKTTLDLLFKFKPFFDRGGLLFDKITLKAKGPVDNLTIYASLEKKDDITVLLEGYLISSGKSISLGVRSDLKSVEGEILYNISMDTEVDLEKSSFNTVLIPPEGKIAISGDYSEWPALDMDIDNQHIKINGFDFLNRAHILSKAVFKDGNFSHLTLDINTESSVFNYQPIDEIEASLWIDRDSLRIIYIKIGDTISASGYLIFADPLRVSLKAVLSDFDINRILEFTGSRGTGAISCAVSGKVSVEGPASKVITEAKIEAGEGRLGSVEYEHMILNLKGIGPMLRVYESRLVRENSFFTLDGTVDVRKLFNDNFMENITVSTDNKTIVWEGWDITRVNDNGDLDLSKGVEGDVKVGFKTHAGEEETNYQTVRPQDEFNLEYGMPKKEGSLQIKARENEDIFGVMKKYKF